MKYLIAIIVCLISKIALAQNYPEAKKFINEVITEKNIIYQDSASRNVLSMMQDALKNNKKHIFYKLKKDSVLLIDDTGVKMPMLRSKATPIVLKEMHSIIQNIDSTIKKNNMLGSKAMPIVPKQKHSRMLPIVEDSLTFSEQEIAHAYKEIAKVSKHKWDNGLFENSKLIPTDTVKKVFADRKLLGWQYMYSKGINKIYSFGMPVFLRNDTYCLFYYDYGCDYLCGYGEFAIYKKDNGKWTYWGRISSWIS
jgi:uncharacterized protein YjcR